MGGKHRDKTPQAESKPPEDPRDPGGQTKRRLNPPQGTTRDHRAGPPWRGDPTYRSTAQGKFTAAPEPLPLGCPGKLTTLVVVQQQCAPTATLVVVAAPVLVVTPVVVVVPVGVQQQ